MQESAQQKEEVGLHVLQTVLKDTAIELQPHFS